MTTRKGPIARETPALQCSVRVRVRGSGGGSVRGTGPGPGRGYGHGYGYGISATPAFWDAAGVAASQRRTSSVVAPRVTVSSASTLLARAAAYS